MAAWALTTSTRRDTYLPQIEDELVYLQYLHAIQLDQLAADEAVIEGPKLQRFRVAQVEYISPASKSKKQTTIAKLTVVDGTGRMQSLKFRPVEWTVDFLVLAEQYDAAKADWRVNDRCLTIIEDDWWAGTVIDIRPGEAQELEVRFDKREQEDQTEYVGRWEIQPLPSGFNTSAKPTNEDLEKFAVVGLGKIEPDVRKLMSSEIQKLKVARSSVKTKSYPVNLKIIRERLAGNFYRRISALVYDVKALGNTEATALIERLVNNLDQSTGQSTGQQQLNRKRKPEEDDKDTVRAPKVIKNEVS